MAIDERRVHKQRLKYVPRVIGFSSRLVIRLRESLRVWRLCGEASAHLSTAAETRSSLTAQTLSHQSHKLPLKTALLIDSWSFSKSILHANCFLIGRSRMRLPVAANIALQIAGAIGGTPGSPTPAGGASLCTICTRVSTGASSIRATL